MRPPLRLAGLHLLVLWSFAVAQPLFNLLGKNGEFFAARGSTRWDAIVFALVVLLVPPLVLLALEALVPALHPVFVGFLAALFVLQAIRGLGAPGWLLVVTADHGISFRAGQKRRPLSSANLQDIAYVPLFVKAPGQQRGRVVSGLARTTDIIRDSVPPQP